jgi:hypothetical protein
VSLILCEFTIPSSSAYFFGPGPLWIFVLGPCPSILSLSARHSTSALTASSCGHSTSATLHRPSRFLHAVVTAFRRLRLCRLATLRRLLRPLYAVMTAFSRLCLRRLVALCQLSRLLHAVLPAFRQLRLRRPGALHRLSWLLHAVLPAFSSVCRSTSTLSACVDLFFDRLWLDSTGFEDSSCYDDTQDADFGLSFSFVSFAFLQMQCYCIRFAFEGGC